MSGHCTFRCSNAEQKSTIAEGVFKKEVKSQEDKAKNLEEVGNTGVTDKMYPSCFYTLGNSGR